jgi:hypothetical protein
VTLPPGVNHDSLLARAKWTEVSDSLGVSVCGATSLGCIGYGHGMLQLLSLTDANLESFAAAARL